MKSKQLTKNFNSTEFDSPDLVGSGLGISIHLVERLEIARFFYNDVIIIGSGVRTIRHNRAVGGVVDSSHLFGFAVDIEISNSTQRFLLLKALIKAGFVRIGIYSTHLHVDISVTKNAGVIWVK